jgi:hypothetical protein
LVVLGRLVGRWAPIVPHCSRAIVARLLSIGSSLIQALRSASWSLAKASPNLCRC